MAVQAFFHRIVVWYRDKKALLQGCGCATATTIDGQLPLVGIICWQLQVMVKYA
jgi:hypothetical protein